MTSAAGIKAELAALGAATELGFEAGGDAVERIKTLAAALEALNPTPAPASAAHLLHGRWRLLYSSFGLHRDATLGRISFNLLPKTPIHVERLWQEVDPATGLYDNIVDYTADGAPGAQVMLGKFTPASEHRLDVLFTGTVATGHSHIPLDNSKIPPLWSDVTYLDDGFRLNRGGFGSLYVLELVDRNPVSWSRDSI
jgi:PAP_fibrillin